MLNTFRLIFDNFRTFWIFGNVFVYFWCVLYLSFSFVMRLSDSVSFSVYMNIFKRYCSTVLEKMSRSVNKFRTKYYFVIFCDLCDYLVPSPPIPIPGVNVKVPFQEKNIEEICFLVFLIIFMKMKKLY